MGHKKNKILIFCDIWWISLSVCQACAGPIYLCMIEWMGKRGFKDYPLLVPPYWVGEEKGKTLFWKTGYLLCLYCCVLTGKIIKKLYTVVRATVVELKNAVYSLGIFIPDEFRLLQWISLK